MRRVAPLLLCCLLAAACTDTASGVEARNAEPIDTAASSEPVPPVDGTEPPDGTPDTTDAPASGTTEPPDTGDVPDTTEAPATPTLPSTTPPPDSTDPQTTETDTTEPDTTGPGTADTGDGVGDVLFPDLGNPGIDVEHYDVVLAYDPGAGTIDATVTLTIVPTQDRDEFTLDSAGPEIQSVVVDGEDAAFEQDGVELRITPATAMEESKAVDVVVTYSATPDAGSSAGGLPNGWFHTGDGSYVLNEPDGARSWLPSNDHPSDKATWRFTITVPAGMTAVANGDLVESTSGPDGDTWVWEERDPMATYLIQLLTGDYEVVEGTTSSGLPLISVIVREDRENLDVYLETIEPQIEFFEQFFGPYPLDRYGLAITDSFGGLAMETQGRSLFSREDFDGELGFIQQLLLSHELAHMWYGDAVTPGEWQDIWLNEAFATYAEWMWLEEVGMTILDEEARIQLESKDFADTPTGTPSEDDMFGFNVYQGGGVVLHALRGELGDDDTFFELLRRWAQDNAGESRTTEDFVALAEEVAGRDLTQFFDDWLFSVDVPDEFPGS